MIPHSLPDSYSCRNETCATPGKAVSSWEKALLLQACQQTQECPARPCLQLMTTERRTGLIAQGSLSSLLKAHRSYSAEGKASKLIRNKTAYEMWFMAFRWVKRQELGLMEQWQVQVGKVLERCVISLSALWQSCRYLTHCSCYCTATRNCCPDRQPLVR